MNTETYLRRGHQEGRNLPSGKKSDAGHSFQNLWVPFLYRPGAPLLPTVICGLHPSTGLVPLTCLLWFVGPTLLQAWCPPPAYCGWMWGCTPAGAGTCRASRKASSCFSRDASSPWAAVGTRVWCGKELAELAKEKQWLCSTSEAPLTTDILAVGAM